MKDQNDMISRTAMFSSPPVAMPAALITRMERVLPQSPATPSPAGAARMKSLLRRLEEINIESLELLKELFSMLEKDMRLERYIRRRLEEPKVSHMWELVEQILATKQGHVDFDELFDAPDDQTTMDKGVKLARDDHESGLRPERFKIRMLETDDQGAAKTSLN
ncbi:hypothetical protein Ancab_031708 [Ancistrocladus abbreviatus]